MVSQKRSLIAYRCPSVLRKTAFLSRFYIKTIILPRQARNKHRGKALKNRRMPFFAPITSLKIADVTSLCCLRASNAILGMFTNFLESFPYVCPGQMMRLM
jgi:hypothetical protein